MIYQLADSFQHFQQLDCGVVISICCLLIFLLWILQNSDLPFPCEASRSLSEVSKVGWGYSQNGQEQHQARRWELGAGSCWELEDGVTPGWGTPPTE